MNYFDKNPETLELFNGFAVIITIIVQTLIN